MAFYRCGSGGGTKGTTGIITLDSSATTTKIKTGFKPSAVILYHLNNSQLPEHKQIYDSRISTTKFVWCNGAMIGSWVNLSNASTYTQGFLCEINNDGFTLAKGTGYGVGPWYYVASE